MNIVESERNRLYGDHRVFLRQLCALYPDVEAEARDIVTTAAKALHGKKGLMVHQVYQPQQPSVEQTVEPVDSLQIDNTDFKSCLKGIAKRLVINQSNPSSGNVAHLISLANTPELLVTALNVMRAQRWHLRAGHEPLSKRLFSQTIKSWPTAEPDWHVKLGDFLESAVSKETNYATIMTPKVLAATVNEMVKRLTRAETKPEVIWAWTYLSIRLFNIARVYCGEFLEDQKSVALAYLNLFTEANDHNMVDPEFSPPETTYKLRSILFDGILSSLGPEVLPVACPYVLCKALKTIVHNREPVPGYVTEFLKEQDGFLRCFLAYENRTINLEMLEQITIAKDPQGFDANVRKFLLHESSKSPETVAGPITQ
jgi:hypothetical protein